VVIDPDAITSVAPDAQLMHLLRAQIAQDLLHDSAAMPFAQPVPAVH